MAALLFDVETAPLPDAADYLEAIEPPGNYTKPEAIAAYIEKERAKQLGKCALDVDLCRVVAIGVWPWDLDAPETCLADAGDEHYVLRWFWEHVTTNYRGSDLVGFNVLAFDLPVLLRRSLYLGVKTPKLTINKYRPGRVVDLLQELTHQGMLRMRSQEFYCKRFGITVDDPCDGKDVPALVEAGNWATVAAHCRADLYRLRGLSEKLGILQTKELCAVEPTQAAGEPF